MLPAVSRKAFIVHEAFPATNSSLSISWGRWRLALILARHIRQVLQDDQSGPSQEHYRSIRGKGLLHPLGFPLRAPWASRVRQRNTICVEFLQSHLPWPLRK